MMCRPVEVPCLVSCAVHSVHGLIIAVPLPFRLLRDARAETWNREHERRRPAVMIGRPAFSVRNGLFCEFCYRLGP